jgi:hypothetical protein
MSGLRVIDDTTWHAGKSVCFLAASQVLLDSPDQKNSKLQTLAECWMRAHRPRWLGMMHSRPE